MAQQLGRLLTDLGERSTYDAASQCSRCGYCEQACPTYVATGRESQSARGRNQIVRLMLEGKLADPSEASEALSTCLLCGACSTACYAHVPTADIVLEGRRRIQKKSPLLARLLMRLLINRPGLFAFGLKIAYFFKSTGISSFCSPLLRLMGMGGLAQADKHVKEVPNQFLFEALNKRPSPQRPAWLYFAACGSNYLFPQVGLATWKVLEEVHGPGRFLDNSCCGLLSNNYGDIADARKLAQRNIEKWESASAGSAPTVADCSSCVAFLKSYPQLFLEDPSWRTRAAAFSAQIRDAVEVLQAPASQSSLPQTVVYHESCRACHGQGLKAPEALLRQVCGSGYRKLQESDVCCGGAGAFSFLHPELSDEVLRRKIGNIARTQAKIVVTSSTSCLIQLAHGLRKYYPQGQVMHLSQFLAIFTDSHGA